MGGGSAAHRDQGGVKVHTRPFGAQQSATHYGVRGPRTELLKNLIAEQGHHIWSLRWTLACA
jgi:hypothetical protein